MTWNRSARTGAGRASRRRGRAPRPRPRRRTRPVHRRAAAVPSTRAAGRCPRPRSPATAPRRAAPWRAAWQPPERVGQPVRRRRSCPARDLRLVHHRRDRLCVGVTEGRRVTTPSLGGGWGGVRGAIAGDRTVKRQNRPMALDGIRYRAATSRDAAIVAELMAAGFATYRDFTVPGWRPRAAIQDESEVHARLSRGDVHSRLALAADGTAAGVTGWMPSLARTDRRERVPGRAHLWTLFVARSWWGTGLAADLLAWSVDGMRDSGYTDAQLWTPRDHARARAFYEREGWRPTQRAEYSPELGLDLILYERRLG